MHVLVSIWCDQTENTACLLSDRESTLFVSVVVSWHVEIYNVGDLLDHRSLCISCLQHNQQVKLANVEEMQDGADLRLGHVS